MYTPLLKNPSVITLGFRSRFTGGIPRTNNNLINNHVTKLVENMQISLSSVT